MQDHHEIDFSSSRIAKVLLLVVVVLVLLSIIGQFFRFFMGHGRVLGFVPEFNLNRENNIPAYFSSLLLLTSAGLLFLIASLKRESQDAFTLHWTALAVIFLYMSVDESASLHERLNVPLGNLLDTGEGWFRLAWVIPGLAFVLLFALVYLRFFIHLSKRFKRLFLSSAVIYVAGALGMEMIGGKYAGLYGWRNFPFSLITAVEEALEMTGLALFIYTLMQYLKSKVHEVRLRFD